MFGRTAATTPSSASSCPDGADEYVGDDCVGFAEHASVLRNERDEAGAVNEAVAEPHDEIGLVDSHHRGTHDHVVPPHDYRVGSELVLPGRSER